MFSGIVETTASIKSIKEGQGSIQLILNKPSFFDDLHVGDSVAVDGVCLTIESFNSETMTFTLAAETLQVLQWNFRTWNNKIFNVERSLKLSDRIHGHLVTGHVDSLGEVTKAERNGDSFFVDVSISPGLAPYVWKKGSLTISGVSLTLNDVVENVVSVCLIPETLKRTNLGLLKVGDKVNIEPDYMARALLRAYETGALKKNV